MKKLIRKAFLKALNSRFLNNTPCEYGFINGLEAVSYRELKNEVIQNPHILVRDLIRSIDQFKSCPLYPHVHENGTTRPIDNVDIEDLKRL
jgi:hypothetical protein